MSSFRIFETERQTLTIVENRWVREELAPDQWTYVLRPTAIQYRDLDTASRGAVDKLRNSETDYSEILERITAIDYVLELIRDYGENLTVAQKTEIYRPLRA